MRNGNGQIDDHLVIGCRLPDLDDLVADLGGKFGLGSRKALGRVFKGNVAAVLGAVFFTELGAEDGNVLDLLLRAAEDLLTLGDRGRVIQMHDGVGRTVNGLEGLGNDVLARLRQHLNGHVIGDQTALDDGAAEFIFGFGGGGEADLDLLEAELAKELDTSSVWHG